MAASSTVYFSDGEDAVVNGVSETINNATGSPTQTSDTLSDGSVVQVLDGDHIADTLGDGGRTVTDNSSDDDIIYGNNGGDTFTLTGSGNYTINGGNGSDTVYARGSGNYTINGGNGSDTIYASGSANYIINVGNGSDTVYATGSGNYTITGGNGRDVIDASGSVGNHTLIAGNGDGNDILKAGKGHDTLTAGRDGDLLYSGTGTGETDFLYNTVDQSPYAPTSHSNPAWVSDNWLGDWDVIIGFKHGTDKADLSGLKLNSDGPGGLVWAGQPYVTSANGDAASGEANPALAYSVWNATDTNGVTYLYANTDGDGEANLKIQVAGSGVFTSADFTGVGILLTEQLADDSGISATDNLANNGEVIGVSGDADAVVNLVVDNTVTATVTAAANGSWSYAPSLTDGVHTIVASETDATGNTGSASLIFTLDADISETVTLSLAGTLIGSAAASAEHFTISGSQSDDSGAVVFSDGIHFVTVSLTAGQTSGAADLRGLHDGLISSLLTLSDPAGNTFTAAGNTVTLDHHPGQTVGLTIGDTLIGSASASAVPFAISGGGDDHGKVVFGDGNHFVTVGLTAGQTSGAADLSGLADGSIGSSLTLSDAAGNTFTATGNTVALDQDKGEHLTLSVGTLVGSAAASAEHFTISGSEPDDSGAVVFGDGNHFVTVGLTAGQTSGTADLSGLGDGLIGSPLTLSDPAGNTFTAAGNTVTLDHHPGQTVGLTIGDTLIGSASASAVPFAVSGGGDDHGKVVFGDGNHFVTVGLTAGQTSGAADLSGLADGSIGSLLTLSDAAGNTFTATGNTVALDQDKSEHLTLSVGTPVSDSAAASAEHFTISGSEPDDSGAVVFSDGNHFVTVSLAAGQTSGTADLSGLADGLIGSSLMLSDPAGNTFSAAGNTVTLDHHPGQTVGLTIGDTLVGSASASAVPFAVSGGGDDHGKVAFGDGNHFVTVGLTAGQTSGTANLSGLNDGPIGSSLTLSDAAGNTFTATGNTVTLDQDKSEHLTLSVRTPPSDEAAASPAHFTISGSQSDDSGAVVFGDGNHFVTVSLTAGQTSGTADLSGLADGLIGSSLTLSDPAGNTFTATGNTLTFDRDKSEHVTLSVGTPGSAAASAPHFTISGSEPDDGGAVVFSDGAHAVTVSLTAGQTGGTADLSGLNDGSIGSRLTLSDPAGNTFTATGNTVTLDRDAGETATLVVENATETGGSATATFVISGLLDETGAGNTGTVSFAEGKNIVTVGVTGNGTYTANLSALASGTVATALVFTDAAGNSFAATGNDVTIVTGKKDKPAGVAGSPINLALTDPAGVAGGSVAVAIAGVPAGWSLNAGTDLGNGSWIEHGSDLAALAITAPARFAGAIVLGVNETWTNPDGSSGGQSVADNVEAYAPGNPIDALNGDDTLTGSGANDLFVFAQPIGNDTIDNFTPASDQIDLIGFANVTSFAEIQANLANDTSGNAVITLGSGEAITITGVGPAALAAGNFRFNEAPATTNAGTMTIADGAVLPLDGSVDNTGTIALASTGGETELDIEVRGVSLRGGGQVVLSDDGQNVVTAGDPGAVLTNLDNTISGAGRLGDGTLTLDNAGVIDATGKNALVIDTGANAVINSGIIEATGGGGLVARSAIANTGTLWADGGNVTVEGAATGGGAARISGSATLGFGAASDAKTSFEAGASGTLQLAQSGAFSGTVAGFGAGDALDLADIAFGSNDTLGYAANAAGTGGTLTVSDGTHAANLALLGQYAAGGFATAADRGGGTIVTYAPASGSGTDQALLTNPQH